MRASFQRTLIHFASFADHIEDAFAEWEASGHARESQALVHALIDGARVLRRGLVALSFGESERSVLALLDGYEVRWQRMESALDGRGLDS